MNGKQWCSETKSYKPTDAAGREAEQEANAAKLRKKADAPARELDVARTGILTQGRAKFGLSVLARKE